jgi:hypothetical protein
VSVSIKELSGVDGANAQLTKLGVPIRVARVEATCSATAQAVPMSPTIVSDLTRHDGEDMEIQPNLIPQGDTLVISARQLGGDIGLSYGLYRGSVPTCEAPGDSHVG